MKRSESKSKIKHKNHLNPTKSRKTFALDCLRKNGKGTIIRWILKI